jgi:superfamily II DNA helicase RecQ
MKEKVLKSFCDPNGKLRVVIATTAFGMGIDCQDIRCIYHWGPPSNLETYAQETGRAGRDNLTSNAVLLFGNLHRFVEDEMRAYCLNMESCRRKLLLRNFLFHSGFSNIGCSCCDICAKCCQCKFCC